MDSCLRRNDVAGRNDVVSANTPALRLPQGEREEFSFLKLGQPPQRRMQGIVFFGEAKAHNALVKAIAVKG